MSIVVLKRKTAAQYNNNSVNVPQFSLNGTHRSQGWVGQDTRGRSLPKTLMKGNVIKGHGGCCGKYPVRPIVQSAVTSTENPRVVKPSSLNTLGLISTKYRWIRRPQPYTVVKPDNNNNINTQQQYINNLQKQTILDSVSTGACNLPTVTNKFSTSNCGGLTLPQRPRSSACTFTKDFADVNKPKFMTQSQYLMYIDKACSKNDVVYFTAKRQGAPFACNNSHT